MNSQESTWAASTSTVAIAVVASDSNERVYDLNVGKPIIYCKCSQNEY